MITHLDGTRVHAFFDLADVVESSDGRAIDMTVWREGTNEPLQLTLSPKRVDEPQEGDGFVTFWRVGVASSLAFTRRVKA